MLKIPPEKLRKWRKQLYSIIFRTDTPAGKAFDIGLLVVILFSVLMASLESISTFSRQFAIAIKVAEWFITVCFTIEYALRIYSSRNRRKYILSFYGIIDFLSILPSYLGLFINGTQYFVVIRSLRLLRIFRILQLTRFMDESAFLAMAVRKSLDKILVFINFIFILVIILGSLMYVVEGGVNHSFSNIPRSIYWAIVTITTVGYGDITPITLTGQMISAVIMLLGYAIIAVPTGIVTSEIIFRKRKKTSTVCSQCGSNDHEQDAVFCKKCGTILPDKKNSP
ncbi:MAG: ion transporter [Bacteroidaceae bacterium]|nr:ion transporter [Bacteroidaceae bacterium]